MNDQGLSEKKIFSYLETAKSEDTDYYRVLSSMCTHPHKLQLKLTDSLLRLTWVILDFLQELTGWKKK
jgi:glutamate/tyrosine decarboxylase-like PLP-dependent enzyme